MNMLAPLVWVPTQPSGWAQTLTPGLPSQPSKPAKPPEMMQPAQIHHRSQTGGCWARMNHLLPLDCYGLSVIELRV